jgi:hypothetical protein
MLASMIGGASGVANGQSTEDAVQHARHLVGSVLQARIDAGIDRERAASWPLDESETQQVLKAACVELPDRAAYLVLGQRLGVFAISRDTTEYIEELFDLVADETAVQAEEAARAGTGVGQASGAQGILPASATAGAGAGEDAQPSMLAWLFGFSSPPPSSSSSSLSSSSAAAAGLDLGSGSAVAFASGVDDRECVMTVPLLAALCEELGLGFLEGEAREALTATAAVRTGRVLLKPTDWLVVEPPSVMAQYRKKHGEQSAAELAMLAEEVARAKADSAGVEPAPGTQWADVRRAADERARFEATREAATDEGATAAVAVPAYREFTPGTPAVGEEAIRQQRLRSKLVVRSHMRIPMRKSEFVDFLSNVGAGMGEAELRRYVEVFLFMSGLRNAAGVQSPGVATAEAAQAALDR